MPESETPPPLSTPPPVATANSEPAPAPPPLPSVARTRLGLAARWSWFGFLVLLAFGYLAAGLSRDRSEKRDEALARAPSLDLEKSLESAVAIVDSSWKQSIQSQSLEIAPTADWLTICRRISLAMVGTGLSLEEIRNLEALPEADREAIHLANLFEDPRFHDYWAERWTRFLVGTDGGELIFFRRRRFRAWLAEVFQKMFVRDVQSLDQNDRWPYDRLVRELIQAEGLFTTEPQVNFLTATFDSNDGKADPVRLAARTARCFLGLRIDCLQCHNDFLGNVNLGHVDEPREGMQTDFHQLAAFYTSATTTAFQGVVEEEVDYKYQYLDETEETDVQVGVPYLPELLPAEGKPRERLAAWVTHPKNRQAARSAVSHVMALMFGRPDGEAVDNLPLDEACSPVLESLTDDFIENQFDMRRLISVIVRSGSFRCDSRAGFDVTCEHENAGAVFPLVRLRPEQVAGSIIQSSRINTVDHDSSFILQLQKFGSQQDFVSRYGDMGEDEFQNDSVTITQRLLMLNGDMLRDAIEPNPVLNASAHIGMFSADNASVVENTYLAVLNRRPTKEEREVFEKLLSEEERQQAIGDMYWALLNSTEFAWNH